jgi:flagellar biosynthesis protein FlhB
LAKDNLLDRTARASIVIHGSADKVAVALFVDRDPNQVPWLLNKGSGHVADAILTVARNNKVRIVQDPRLAKEIVLETAIDSDIPTRFAATVRGFFG